MTDLPKTAGPRPTPRTATHARKLFSNDKIVSITKEAIASYIESFFLADGKNRDLLGIVSPWSLSLNIDKSFDQRTDITQRKLQVARMYNEIRSIIPAILIMDGGLNPRNENLGQIQSAYLHNSTWDGYFPILKSIPISIVMVTKDQESLNQIAGAISLIFNELRNLAGGHYITGNREEGETWVVTLPQAGISIGPPQDIPVENDPVDKLYFCDMTFAVHYEDVIGIRDTLPVLRPGGSKVNVPNLSKDVLPVIHVPDTIGINDQVTVFIEYFRDNYRIKISDPNIATMSHNMVLTPRTYGTFKIQVYDEGSGANINTSIIVEKEVSVV